MHILLLCHLEPICGYFFVFGCRISFFGRFQHLKQIYLFVFECTGSSLLCAGFFLQLQRAGLLFVAVCGLLIAVASLVVEHGI